MMIPSTARWLAQGSYASVVIYRSQVSPAGPGSLSEIHLCGDLALKGLYVNVELYEVGDCVVAYSGI